MSRNIIDYILANTDLNQKGIAAELGVSPAQISKWRSGEAIPLDRESELNGLAGLFGDDSAWALFAKSEQNSKNWLNYLGRCADTAEEQTNWQIDTEDSCLIRAILLLQDLGVTVPDQPPINWQDDEDDSVQLTQLLFTYFEYHTQLVGWLRENIHSLTDDGSEFEGMVYDLEDEALDLALLYIDPQLMLQLGVKETQLTSFTSEVRTRVLEKLRRLTLTALQEGLPFHVDIFDYLNCHPRKLEDQSLFDGLLAESVERYLPYGQTQILNRVSAVEELLIELHAKVDCLLSTEDKVVLSRILKNTQPLTNKLFDKGRTDHEPS